MYIPIDLVRLYTRKTGMGSLSANRLNITKVQFPIDCSKMILKLGTRISRGRPERHSTDMEAFTRPRHRIGVTIVS